MKYDDELGQTAYEAASVEGWDTEALIEAEMDPEWAGWAFRYANDKHLPWPPEARERDLAGQIIAAAFGL